uniref:Uncharacterized protein n=1 Tax=Anguilla anguilla TaxID=7936 RepID=A0A0E9U5Q5_ANGAN
MTHWIVVSIWAFIKYYFTSTILYS